MQLQILGSGCPTCKKLFEKTKTAVEELQIQAEIEYITDIQKIISLGLMQSPVLVMDGRPILVGRVPDVEGIKDIISKELSR